VSRDLLSRLAWRRSLLEGTRRWFIVTGWRRGVLEGSRTWLVLGASATTLALLRRVLSEKPVEVTFELGRGHGIEIRTVDPPTR
jgi:hypothetical protein